MPRANILLRRSDDVPGTPVNTLNQLNTGSIVRFRPKSSSGPWRFAYVQRWMSVDSAWSLHVVRKTEAEPQEVIDIWSWTRPPTFLDLYTVENIPRAPFVGWFISATQTLAVQGRAKVVQP